MTSRRFVSLRIAVAALVAAIALPAAVTAQSDRWLHVRVIDEGDGATVELNLPIDLVHSAVPMIESASAEARLDIAEHGFGGRELKELLRELTVSPDGEYVRVDDGGDQVRIVREGQTMLVRVHEGDDHGARVEARIPMRVVEALAAGEGDTLDIAAAVEALAEERDGELVTIIDDGGATHVRLWIDASNEQQPEV